MFSFWTCITKQHIFILSQKQIYPNDFKALYAIDEPVALTSGCDDEEYIPKMRKALENSFSEFTPDVIYYNAGTDILDGDPLGRMCISPQGVITRDEVVFGEAFKRKIPIVMLLSGG